MLRDATRDLHRSLCAFVEEFRPDLLITQNSLCIPMQLPLAVAIARLLRSMPWLTAIGHHHDFFWERERFDIRPLVVDTLLERSFPPNRPTSSTWSSTAPPSASSGAGWACAPPSSPT